MKLNSTVRIKNTLISNSSQSIKYSVPKQSNNRYKQSNFMVKWNLGNAKPLGSVKNMTSTTTSFNRNTLNREFRSTVRSTSSNR